MLKEKNTFAARGKENKENNCFKMLDYMFWGDYNFD